MPKSQVCLLQTRTDRRGTDRYVHKGLEKDLNLQGFEFNFALTLFYVAVGWKFQQS